MQDNKITERLKALDKNKPDLSLKVEDQLQLRKQNLFERLMKRRNKDVNVNEELNYIDTKLLAIPQSVIEEYDKKVQSEKIFFLSELICDSNRETCACLMKALWNQTAFFSYVSSTRNTNDLFKWAVYQLFLLSKELATAINKEDDGEEKDIVISSELFISLISEAYESNDLSVKQTVLELLLNYSEVSKTLNNYFIVDMQYIYLLFKLTYLHNVEIIRTIAILLHNIFFDNPSQIQKVLDSIAIHVRVGELLHSNEVSFAPKAKSDLLLLVVIMSQHYRKEELSNSFETFVFIIQHLFEQNEVSNETLFEQSLDVLFELSFNDKLCFLIISTGIGLRLVQYLYQKQVQSEYVYKIMIIIGNLLFYEEIVDFLLNYSLLSVFQKLINTHVNSCNKSDNEILVKLVFALSNISGGTQRQNTMLFNSAIPNALKQMCKIKSSIALTKEVLVFFQNAILSSDEAVLAKLLQSEIIKFFCEQLHRTGDNELIMLCLYSIKDIINRMNSLYHVYENIKNDLMKNAGTRKIEELTQNKNQDVSLIAEDIIRILHVVDDELELEMS